MNGLIGCLGHHHYAHSLLRLSAHSVASWNPYLVSSARTANGSLNGSLNGSFNGCPSVGAGRTLLVLGPITAVVFGGTYLRKPTEENVVRLLIMHKERLRRDAWQARLHALEVEKLPSAWAVLGADNLDVRSTLSAHPHTHNREAHT